MSDLVEDLLAGDHRALARVITKIENRSSGYRDLVKDLHTHTGDARVIGVTGSPGAGKSTLVDKVAELYRDRDLTVGVIAIDPSSPYTGGAVLGDRIRMASNVGDMQVFVRSMSARGSLGGLSTATTDAVKALDAFGKDRIIVETVGAGQNEVDIVKTADTVVVLVQPSSGDDVQMLKAGILEIADVFVVNKADLEGADQTVRELDEMIHGRDESLKAATEHHGPTDSLSVPDVANRDDLGTADTEGWTPPVLETVARTGEGIEAFVEAVDDHTAYLDRTGRREDRVRTRYAEEIRTLLREDTAALVAAELRERGGMEEYVDAVLDRETDPYTVADEILTPLVDCLERGPED